MATRLTTGGGIAVALALALGGCGKMKQSDRREASKVGAQAKRQQAACASSAAYDRLKNRLFDQATNEHVGGRANLDTLADYSLVRMEDPVVKGWDQSLDVIRCAGHLILEIPPGAERAFAGDRRLQADIDYTAQAAADGNGFVYQLEGAEPIVARLAAFNLTSVAYRPPPAIDEPQAVPEGSKSTEMTPGDLPASLPTTAATRSAPAGGQMPLLPDRQPARTSGVTSLDPATPLAVSSPGETGEAAVRAFYDALGAGNGAAASAQIVPEKRSSRSFSPEGISRFYGRLPEPIRLTGLAPLAGGAYSVSYRYSAGRSVCNGSAVVSLTNRGGREFIRSIRALNGC